MGFRAVVLAALCLVLVGGAFATPPGPGDRPGYAEAQACAGCHPRESAAWAASKHRQAMAPARADTVLGDFSTARFAESGQAVVFHRQGERFLIRAAGRDGREADFPVAHTFGVRPLQQYLIAAPEGRLQAFGVAWDTLGQRWFPLLPGNPFPPGSPLHWSGRYQNWNLMCGECHTTAYRKGYDAEADAYQTTWAEGQVGCQACHGPSERHVASARTLSASMPAALRPQRSPELTANRALRSGHDQVDQCASCHSRRTRLAEHVDAGTPLLDGFLPDTLRADLYFPDGQQRDEVFEYGSYRQSRMYQAGVACTECHEPHGGRLRAEGNALCVRCHASAPDPRFPGLRARNYDSSDHHFHAAGSPGSQCVDCHMPSRNYMVVHARRDHAIRTPRPDLGARLGTPNACASCHAGRGDAWAAAAIEARHGAKPAVRHYGEILAAARRGEPDSERSLENLISDGAQPAIVRATAVEALAAWGHRPPPVTLRDPDPVVRASAAAALAQRAATERLDTLPALLDDPRRAVRIIAARGLADLGEAALAAPRRPLLRQALAEYVAAQQAMADMPSAQLNLALYRRIRGESGRADHHYRLALRQDAAVDAARLGLASLLLERGRGDEAEVLLRDGLAVSSAPASLHHALALMAARRQDWHGALEALQMAEALAPEDRRIRQDLLRVRRQLGR